MSTAGYHTTQSPEVHTTATPEAYTISTTEEYGRSKPVQTTTLTTEYVRATGKYFSSRNLIKRTQWAHNFKITSYQRRCDVITSHRR